jgi:curved DNA-binding protein CbpA
MSTLDEVLVEIRASRNHYETLGVKDQTISQNELKKSYYKRSLLVHPGKFRVC